MEALTSSSSKIFAENYRNRAFSSSRALLSRPEICFFPSHTLNNVDVSHSISLQFKPIESSSSSSFSSETQASVENAKALVQATHQSKTVHVKFILQKECLFGQHFLVVGDDPIFGLWEPSNAIPLDWSDGHVWTLELDVPIGKSVQFKFILKGTTGEVVWQPGPDRVFQTWETKNTIVVSGDWENAEVQKITEEELKVQPNKETMVNPNVELILSENITYQNEEPMTSAEKEFIFAEDASYPKEEPMANANKELIVAENITYPKDEPMASENTKLIVAENITYPKEEPKASKESIVAENITPKEEPKASKESIIAENITYPKEEPKASKESIIAENITYPKEEPKASKESIIAENITCPKEEQLVDNVNKELVIVNNNLASNGFTVTGKDSISTKDEENLVRCEGEPVLVPCLAPLPKVTTEETLPKEDENSTAIEASASADEAKDHKTPELHGKQEPDGNPYQKETTVMMFDDGPKEEQHVNRPEENPYLTKEQEQPDCQPTDPDVLQNDLKWGRKTLQKLLTNLGFL